MDIESILRGTCNDVRARFPLKGMNKFYPEKEKISERKLRRAHSTRHDFARADQGKRYDEARDNDLLDDIDARIAWVNGNQIECANCNICSSFAYKELVSRRLEINRAFGHEVNIFRVDAAEPADHQFVLVGEPLPKAPPYGVVLELPFNFDKYSKQGWICDPWANIVCPVRNYNHEWEMKMIKWSKKGKKIGNAVNAAEAVDPGRPAVARSMIRAEKTIMNHFPEDPVLALSADIRRALELLP